MSELTELLGLPIEVEVRGVKYKFTQLTLEDWALLDQWSENEWLLRMKRRAETLKDVPELVNKIHEKIVTIKSFELLIESSSLLDYGEGSSQMLFRQLRTHHGDQFKSVDDVKKFFTDKEFNMIQKAMSQNEDKKDEPKNVAREGD